MYSNSEKSMKNKQTSSKNSLKPQKTIPISAISKEAVSTHSPVQSEPPPFYSVATFLRTKALVATTTLVRLIPMTTQNLQGLFVFLLRSTDKKSRRNKKQRKIKKKMIKQLKRNQQRKGEKKKTNKERTKRKRMMERQRRKPQEEILTTMIWMRRIY